LVELVVNFAITNVIDYRGSLFSVDIILNNIKAK